MAPPTFLQRVSFTSKHVFCHIFLYWIPRAVSFFILKLPKFLWGLWKSPNKRNYLARDNLFHKEREILIVASETDATARRRFGLDRGAAPADGVTYFNTERYEFPLYNGHLQTILGGLRPNYAATDDVTSSRRHGKSHAHAAAPKTYDYTKVYKRETVKGSDGQQLNLDFLFPPGFERVVDAADAAVPVNGHVRGVLFVLPGLLNSSTSNYLFHFARMAARQHYVVCALNWRGMGSKPLEVPRLFSATYTDDIRHVLDSYFFTPPAAEAVAPPRCHAALLRHFGVAVSAEAPIIGVGFSLGGINLIKYVAEQEVRAQEACRDAGPCATAAERRARHRNTPLAAVLCVTSPFDLNGSDVCSGSWQYTQIYEKAFALGLRKYAHHNREMLMQLPNVDTRYFSFDGPREGDGAAAGAEAGARRHLTIKDIRSIRQFDAYINASHNGFDSPEAYYAAANSLPWLERMGAAAAGAPINDTFVCCISNSDDPLCGPPIDTARWRRAVAANPHVVYIETPAGGHLGYVGGVAAEWRGEAGPSDLLLLHLADSFCLRRAQQKSKSA
ncbi:hypothetical protein STCU_01588 [Strigomonas culicis]|uniref:AB hydrolase-1 domain-containing protein n=1 Tax=Strigomonas culicis TaxID=28005 RepID=S9TKP9_9TRYP|nr:hypothetical protein STCU_09780 [Strigomonas culicis]EPY34430.1 hypothetical protein STCU_01588 [Strigomonas culicis]|eukprot:EPY18777.1 hypothetical protein STCU_09780 [Strigomonas culicis]